MTKLPPLALLVAVSAVTACTVDGAAGDQPQPTAPERAAAAPPAPAASSDDPMAMPPKPGPGMAMVRAIHASPDAPKVDVYVKGKPAPVVTNLAYGKTSGWIEVPKGTYEFELRAAPSKPSDPIAYQTGALAIEDGQMISAVAAGLLDTIDTSASFRVLAVAEQFGVVPTGKVRIRALHAGSDAPAVDLDVGNDDPGNAEVKGLARFTDTGAAGIALPAGQRLAIGIAKDAARVTSFTTPKLPDGGQLLVIATGLLEQGFSLLAIGPNGALGFIAEDPMVYALHASPDAPRVDAFVGDAEIVSDLGFGELSSPLQVQPGSYGVDFYGATAGTMRPATKPAASSSTGDLVAGGRYLAVATGFLAGGTFSLVSVRDAFGWEEDKSLLRLVHASPDAPAVDTGLVQNATIAPVLFPDVAFTKTSAEEGLAATPGHLVVGVTPAGKNSAIVARFTVPATAQQRAFVVAAGALDASKGKAFRLLVVDTAEKPWTVSTLLAH